MFGSLKDKLKSWLKKSTENVEESAPKEEISEEVKPEKTSKKKSETKKSNKKIVEAEEISEIDEKAIEKFEKQIQESNNLESEEVPQKFETGQLEFEPDLEKIKEEVKELTPSIHKIVRGEIFPKGLANLEEENKKDLDKLEENIQETKKSFFSRLKSSFQYRITKENFEDIFEDLEMLLLENNVALEVVDDLRKNLSERLIDKEIKKENLESEIKAELKKSINDILIEPDDILNIIKLSEKKPFVILFFGINGAGKTTSIAKTTYLLKKAGFKCVLAAGDTFRAASIEQLQIHADKLEVPLVKHDYNSDPAAVGFDAIKYAEKHKLDVVLIDTAGRMHTKTNLLNEIEKIVRVTKPDLKVFVAESVAGNDAVEQATVFNETLEIDGSILSKVDVDEKGGTIISVSHATKKPIFYLGVGQEYKDLKLFNKEEFVKNLGL